jgi:hypothetical protein
MLHGELQENVAMPLGSKDFSLGLTGRKNSGI